MKQFYKGRKKGKGLSGGSHKSDRKFSFPKAWISKKGKVVHSCHWFFLRNLHIKWYSDRRRILLTYLVESNGDG